MVMVTSARKSTTDNSILAEWIQTALVEYEEIASLCNAQSRLGNTAAAMSHAATGHEQNLDLDPKNVTIELQRRCLFDELSEYYRAVNLARKTHASMKAQLCKMSDVNGNDKRQTIERERRLTLPVVADAFSRHIELSERVIRTVMMQSSPHTGGPCGILFENGIVRHDHSQSTSSSSRQEVNVVALSSLRASVSRLKASFVDNI